MGQDWSTVAYFVNNLQKTIDMMQTSRIQCTGSAGAYGLVFALP
jgi:hypothetical protein